MIAVSTLINVVFLWGSIERLYSYSQISNRAYSFGFLWPSLLWFTFIAVNIYYLIYLQKLDKTNLIQRKHLIMSFGLLIAPHLLSYIFGMFFTLQAIKAINS